jgi:hypothetical protein
VLLGLDVIAPKVSHRGGTQAALDDIAPPSTA